MVVTEYITVTTAATTMLSETAAQFHPIPTMATGDSMEARLTDKATSFAFGRDSHLTTDPTTVISTVACMLTQCAFTYWVSAVIITKEPFIQSRIPSF